MKMKTHNILLTQSNSNISNIIFHSFLFYSAQNNDIAAIVLPQTTNCFMHRLFFLGYKNDKFNKRFHPLQHVDGASLYFYSFDLEIQQILLHFYSYWKCASQTVSKLKTDFILI